MQARRHEKTNPTLPLPLPLPLPLTGAAAREEADQARLQVGEPQAERHAHAHQAAARLPLVTGDHSDHQPRDQREIMGTDVRLEDAERARARYDSNVAGLDSMFEQAMAMKNKRL